MLMYGKRLLKRSGMIIQNKLVSFYEIKNVFVMMINFSSPPRTYETCYTDGKQQVHFCRPQSPEVLNTMHRQSKKLPGRPVTSTFSLKVLHEHPKPMDPLHNKFLESYAVCQMYTGLHIRNVRGIVVTRSWRGILVNCKMSHVVFGLQK